jgi:phospholipid-binding lipoprotein MlaA
VNIPTFAFLALLLCLSGCAASSKHSDAQPVHATAPAVGDDFSNVPVQQVDDPFLKLNRTVFGMNDNFTNLAIRPLAHGYAAVVPLPVRNSLTNFFDNLQFPVRFVNSVLQGKLVRSAQETGKFVVNSTAGIGGLFRVSDHVTSLADVPASDFGQTLGVWGIRPGPYLVLPLLGPSDCRDLVGIAGDYVISPLDWHTLGFIHCAYIPNAASIGLGVTRFVNGLPKAIDTYDQLKSGAVDPYIAIRDAYLSNRAAQIKK